MHHLSDKLSFKNKHLPAKKQTAVYVGEKTSNFVATVAKCSIIVWKKKYFADMVYIYIFFYMATVLWKCLEFARWYLMEVHKDISRKFASQYDKVRIIDILGYFKPLPSYFDSWFSNLFLVDIAVFTSMILAVKKIGA